MSIAEILVISIGLSIDVAVAYLGAGFSKIRARNLAGLSLLFGGMQLGGLIIGNLVTLLPAVPTDHSKKVADGWEGITVLIFAGLGIYMICKGVKRNRSWNAGKTRSNGRRRRPWLW